MDQLSGVYVLYEYGNSYLGTTNRDFKKFAKIRPRVLLLRVTQHLFVSTLNCSASLTTYITLTIRKLRPHVNRPENIRQRRETRACNLQRCNRLFLPANNRTRSESFAFRREPQKKPTSRQRDCPTRAHNRGTKPIRAAEMQFPIYRSPASYYSSSPKMSSRRMARLSCMWGQAIVTKTRTELATTKSFIVSTPSTERSHSAKPWLSESSSSGARACDLSLSLSFVFLSSLESDLLLSPWRRRWGLESKLARFFALDRVSRLKGRFWVTLLFGMDRECESRCELIWVRGDLGWR